MIKATTIVWGRCAGLITHRHLAAYDLARSPRETCPTVQSGMTGLTTSVSRIGTGHDRLLCARIVRHIQAQILSSRIECGTLRSVAMLVSLLATVSKPTASSLPSHRCWPAPVHLSVCPPASLIAAGQRPARGDRRSIALRSARTLAAASRDGCCAMPRFPDQRARRSSA